jgi:glycosyltransferase involved in cell wall biosynthesis
MNICHIIGTLDPAAGGPTAVAMQLAVAEAAQGHDVVLLTWERPGREQLVHQSIASVAGTDRVTFHRLPQPAKLARALGTLKDPKIKTIVQQAQVIHMHGVWEPMLRHVAHLCRRLSKPYVITPHGMLYPYCLAQKRLKKQLALTLGYRSMLNAAAAIHALNADEARFLAPMHLRPPVRVIANGMERHVFDPLPEQGRFRAQFPQLAQRPFWLFVGRLHPIKGLDVLVESFALFARQNEDVDLVLLGPDDGVGPTLRQRVQDLGLTPRVHFLGPVFGPAKFQALRDAWGYVQTSRHETFSMAITEALAFGKPVVITENCHFPEVAEVNAGVIAPLNAQAIAQAMLEVAGDETRATALGQAGRQLVNDRFLWPVIAQQMLDTYAGLQKG